jgi:3-phenylpropionate/trans-cinnamate dioxygenase ferredoxin component
VNFVRICFARDVLPSTCREFEAGRRRVLICEYQGAYYAHGAICPHRGNSLDGAPLWKGAIDCPWHHYLFDVVTGQSQDPARDVPSLQTFPLERRGDDLYVAFPSDQEPYGDSFGTN